MQITVVPNGLEDGKGVRDEVSALLAMGVTKTKRLPLLPYLSMRTAFSVPGMDTSL